VLCAVAWCLVLTMDSAVLWLASCGLGWHCARF
jgi:hypothetical protein